MRKMKVIIDGVAYDVEVQEDIEDIGKEIPLSVIEDAAIKSEPVKAAPVKKVSGEGTALKTPMPGMVIGFKVANGASVKKGQTVLSLEAMKMENDIAANADGVINFVAVKGANVDTGDVLAYIK